MRRREKLAKRPHQVRELTRGWVQRSYLKRDGWWAQLVLDQFDFLLDQGFSLTSSELAGVHFHQKGNYITYERFGPRPERITFSYNPESGGWIDATIDSALGYERLDDLLRRLGPADSPPEWMIRPPRDASAMSWHELVAEPEPITDQPHIERKVEWWAEKLRALDRSKNPDSQDGSGRPLDWTAWHADYDADTPLRRRLEIVQRHIVDALASIERSPVRVISMCAGEARDLRGALAQVKRRDLVGRLVELDAGLAENARRGLSELGVVGVEVVTGDAGELAVYRPAAPADLVLECGVFGNISDEDVERTVRASPALCAPGATVIWTRSRRAPDLTDAIRAWFVESGFEEIAFEGVPDSEASVGVARFVGQTGVLTDQRLFTFIRETL